MGGGGLSGIQLAAREGRKDLKATRDPRVPSMLVCLALESDSEAVTLTSDRQQLTMGVSTFGQGGGELKAQTVSLLCPTV